jgi:hypothetical protein
MYMAHQEHAYAIVVRCPAHQSPVGTRSFFALHKILVWFWGKNARSRPNFPPLHKCMRSTPPTTHTVSMQQGRPQSRSVLTAATAGAVNPKQLEYLCSSLGETRRRCGRRTRYTACGNVHACASRSMWHLHSGLRWPQPARGAARSRWQTCPLLTRRGLLGGCAGRGSRTHVLNRNHEAQTRAGIVAQLSRQWLGKHPGPHTRA